MGQSQSSDNPYAPMAVLFQELERLKFAQNIRSNPAEYAAFVNERVDKLSTEIADRKRAAFQKAHIDLGRYMDMDHNANFFKVRAADVDRMSASMDANNGRIQQALQHDKDITRRQFEINEWQNYNKLETLFFLQVFFISALVMAIVIFLNKNAMITNEFAGLVTALLFVAVVTLGVYRYFYTNRTRDPRLWHRRYFGTTAPPKPALSCGTGGAVELDINQIVPPEVTQCLDTSIAKFDTWQENLQKEILAFQETGSTPSRIGGSGGSLKQTLCGKA